jgi:hypothetical protein
MKPRLESAEYTAEDMHIHLRHYNASAELARFGGALFGIARVQDCRDADLMLQAQEVAQFGPCPLELYGIPCRGWSIGSYKQVDEL